jgi:hypothetical protein
MGLGSSLDLARVGRPPRIPIAGTWRQSCNSGCNGQCHLRRLYIWPYGIALVSADLRVNPRAGVAAIVMPDISLGARVKDKVPSPNRQSRGAQLNG